MKYSNGFVNVKKSSSFNLFYVQEEGSSINLFKNLCYMRKFTLLFLFSFLVLSISVNAQFWDLNGDTLYRESPVILGGSSGGDNSMLTTFSNYSDQRGGGYGLLSKHSSDHSYLKFRSRSRVGYSSIWSTQAQGAAFAGTTHLTTDHSGEYDSNSGGGIFVLELTNYRPYNSNLSSTNYLGGSVNILRGNIQQYPKSAVISAVIGRDKIQNDSTFAGYFEGRGFFQDNVGFGTKSPAAKVEIADGDVYISDVDKGIIMKSPDGNCWKGVLDNTGMLQFSAVECPDSDSVNSSSGNVYRDNVNVSVFPNPVEDNISVRIDDPAVKGAYFALVNVNGHTLDAGVVDGNKLDIDARALKSGNYILNLMDEQGAVISSEKLIKE